MLEDILEIGVEAGDIGARAAHIESDDLLETGGAGHGRRADNATRRAGKQAVFGVK